MLAYRAQRPLPVGTSGACRRGRWDRRARCRESCAPGLQAHRGPAQAQLVARECHTVPTESESSHASDATLAKFAKKSECGTWQIFPGLSSGCLGRQVVPEKILFTFCFLGQNLCIFLYLFYRVLSLFNHM